MIFPDDQIVLLKVSIFLVMTIHCLHHIAILSDSDSRVNVEPSQNNYRFLDGFMSSKSCNLKIMSQTQRDTAGITADFLTTDCET